MTFDQLQLDAEILHGVEEAGFERCTEVQEKAIPVVLQRRDVMVQSQTGTGKTAAFLLPIFHLLRNDDDLAGSRALIIAPTRELAVQIKEEADLLATTFDIRTAVFHGGVGYKPQLDALAEGVDIMVGTPGRVIDLTQSGKMPLKEVRLVVIDEADRLFDMGFYPDLRRIMRMVPPREQRVNMLFSATLSTKARNIAWDHMNDPVEIEVQPEQITVDTVEQRLYHVATEEKMSVLLGILAAEKPKNAIIFTNTKRYAEEISKRLEINGYPTEYIMGDLPQRKRLSIIRKLKSGESEFLVATDVAARGLHIDNLEMVINYDLPEDPEAYVHRIGRTARAGESGLAVSLACQRYVFGLDAIETLIEQKIPVAKISDDLYAEDASAGRRVHLRSDERPGGSRGRSGRSPSRNAPRGGDRRRSSTRGKAPARGGTDRDSRPPERGQTETTARPENRRQRPHHERPQRQGTGATGPRSSDSLEQRLAYYRKKYGEDFQPTDEMLASMDDRKGGRRRTSSPKSPQKASKQETGGSKTKKKRGFGAAIRSLFGND